MNNNNAEDLSRMGHKLVNELQTMGHEFINTAMSVSVPIINTMAGVEIPSSASTNFKSNIKFYKKNFPDKILICCEIPGVSKENCKINYSNRMLKVCGTSCFTDDWGFIKSREYNLQLDIGERKNSDIKVKYENGLLKIRINVSEQAETNIEID